MFGWSIRRNDLAEAAIGTREWYRELPPGPGCVYNERTASRARLSARRSVPPPRSATNLRLANLTCVTGVRVVAVFAVTVVDALDEVMQQALLLSAARGGEMSVGGM